MKTQTLQIDRLLAERLILILFTIPICKHLIDDDFSDSIKMGLKKGRSWPDKDVIETLPKILNNLSQVESTTWGSKALTMQQKTRTLGMELSKKNEEKVMQKKLQQNL